MLGGQRAFTSFPVPVHKIPEAQAAWLLQVKCITSTDRFPHWKEVPDRLGGRDLEGKGLGCQTLEPEQYPQAHLSSPKAQSCCAPAGLHQNQNRAEGPGTESPKGLPEVLPRLSRAGLEEARGARGCPRGHGRHGLRGCVHRGAPPEHPSYKPSRTIPPENERASMGGLRAACAPPSASGGTAAVPGAEPRSLTAPRPGGVHAMAAAPLPRAEPALPPHRPPHRPPGPPRAAAMLTGEGAPSRGGGGPGTLPDAPRRSGGGRDPPPGGGSAAERGENNRE